MATSPVSLWLKWLPLVAGLFCILISGFLQIEGQGKLPELLASFQPSRSIELIHKAGTKWFSSDDLESPIDNTNWDPVIQDYTFRPDPPFLQKNRTQIGVEKATIFMLVRNSELHGALQAMREIEDRFNRHYRYPWTFYNDELFTEEFKTMTAGMASGTVEYGHIPHSDWSIPDHIDPEKVEQCLQDYEEQGVIYGGVLSYRHMCRFNSGFFYRQQLLEKYDWYWRVEPDTHFYCDLTYDPFTMMRQNGKVYGFVIAIPEYPETIPTLWNTTKAFFESNPDVLAPNNAAQFLLDKSHPRPDDIQFESDDDYNLCHFWSNFEIANLNFFRSEQYQRYFEYLDKAGGFFYERWGDAPVHTIGLSMMLNKTQIHHFSDIGYRHEPYYRCPHDDASYVSGRCFCLNEKPGENMDFSPISCLPKWYIHGSRPFLFKYQDQLLLT